MEHKKSMFKRIVSSAVAGVIGAGITLASVQYFDVNKDPVQSNKDSQEVSSSRTNVQEVAADSTSIADIVEQSSKAIVGVVNIQNQGGLPQQATKEQAGTGSGVIYKTKGEEAYIVTNNHVIEGAGQIDISLEDGTEVTAELIGADPLSDIAVLKVKGDYDIKPIAFGDSDLLRAGDQVIAIGNPLGLDLSRTVTQGIVSAVNRTIDVTTSAGDWDLEVIQTDAAINPGNSGGALINVSGQLVGINSLKITESGVEGLGFAIPSNIVSDIAEEIIKNGKVVRPYLGVSVIGLNKIPSFYLQDLPKEITGGVMVASVDEGSAIAKAGIKTQDIITSINGESIEDEKDLRKFLYNKLSIGDEVQLDIYREGNKEILRAKLGSNENNE